MKNFHQDEISSDAWWFAFRCRGDGGNVPKGNYWGRSNLICLLTNLLRTLLFPAHQATQRREMRFSPPTRRLALNFSSPLAKPSIAEVEMEILKMLPLMHAWLNVSSRFANSLRFSSFEAFHWSGCSSATGFHSTIIHDLCINANIKHEHKNKFYQLKWQTKKTVPSCVVGFAMVLFSPVSTTTLHSQGKGSTLFPFLLYKCWRWCHHQEWDSLIRCRKFSSRQAKQKERNVYF